MSVIRNEERGQVIGGGGKELEGKVRDWRGRQGIGGGGKGSKGLEGEVKKLEGEVRNWRER